MNPQGDTPRQGRPGVLIRSGSNIRPWEARIRLTQDVAYILTSQQEARAVALMQRHIRGALTRRAIKQLVEQAPTFEAFWCFFLPLVVLFGFFWESFAFYLCGFLLCFSHGPGVFSWFPSVFAYGGVSAGREVLPFAFKIGSVTWPE